MSLLGPDRRTAPARDEDDEERMESNPGMLSRSACRVARAAAGSALFDLSVFLVPFENLFFAPSKGWAAVAPIGFFLYVLVHLRSLPEALVRLRKPLVFLAAIVGVSSLNYLRYPPHPAILLDSARSLALGVTFLVALVVHFEVRGEGIGRTLRILAVAYGVSLGIGLLQYVALHWKLEGVLQVMSDLSARSTLLKGRRVQFTFTEPAYAAMHVYGVLLPLVVLFASHPGTRTLRWVFLGLAAAALLTGSSIRFVVDTAVAAILGVAWLVVRGRRFRFPLAAAAAVALVALGVLSYRTLPRVRNIVTEGVSGDSSLQSRWFRVNAVRHGLAEEPWEIATGYGLSNLRIPFRRGYAAARAEYRGGHRVEVRFLGRNDPTSLLSMPVRLLVEFGAILSVAILVALFSPRWALLYVLVFYVYLTFDSYAFYTVWIYLFFSKIRPPERFGAGPSAS
jgi:hypothetical protein